MFAGVKALTTVLEERLVYREREREIISKGFCRACVGALCGRTCK